MSQNHVQPGLEACQQLAVEACDDVSITKYTGITSWPLDNHHTLTSWHETFYWLAIHTMCITKVHLPPMNKFCKVCLQTSCVHCIFVHQVCPTNVKLGSRYASNMYIVQVVTIFFRPRNAMQGRQEGDFRTVLFRNINAIYSGQKKLKKS